MSMFQSMVRVLVVAGTAACASGAVAQSYNWSGFYLGANVGANWTNADARFSNLPNPIVGGGDGKYDFGNSGVSGGIHAGYNVQFSSFVVGIEGDYSVVGGGSKKTAIRIDQTLFPGFSEHGTSEVDWLATLRARLGWSVGSVLLYGTIGYGWSDVDLKYSAYQAPVAGATEAGTTGKKSSSLGGLAIGAGFEWALDRNWVVRGEYIHVDLGSVTMNTPETTDFGATSTKINYDIDILRAGLSYKF